MKAALLPDRGVVKVTGDGARTFLNGLFTADIGKVTPGAPRFAALLTPQGKIILDAIVAEAEPSDGSASAMMASRMILPCGVSSAAKRGVSGVTLPMSAVNNPLRKLRAPSPVTLTTPRSGSSAAFIANSQSAINSD